MPGYIPTTLKIFQHKPPARPQDAPHPWNKPVYGKHIQLATQQSSAPKLNSAETNHVQSINGTFLYCASTVEPTVLPFFNKITICQYAPIQDKIEKFEQVLDYASMHLNATIQFHASDTIRVTNTYYA